MRKAVLSVVVLTFIIIFAGCATLPLESNLDKPVNMTGKNAQVKTFVSNSKAIWIFWGLAPISLPTVDEVVMPKASSVKPTLRRSQNPCFSYIFSLLPLGFNNCLLCVILWKGRSEYNQG